MRNAENLGFWKKYAATIDSSTISPVPGADDNLNKPPQRQSRMIVSYSVVVKK
jgi:hypothetical protein